MIRSEDVRKAIRDLYVEEVYNCQFMWTGSHYLSFFDIGFATKQVLSTQFVLDVKDDNSQ